MKTDAVNSWEMMESREQRAQRQQDWLAAGKEQGMLSPVLISLGLNIPGQIKLGLGRELGFTEACAAIDRQLQRLGQRAVRKETWLRKTGCEGFWLLEADAMRVKRAMTVIEEQHELGRLFDIDVLDAAGRPLSRSELGLPLRRCLLCGQPAQICGRSRAHAVEELIAATDGRLSTYFREQEADRAAELAAKALLCEVSVTPKPGLVDRHDPGSHRDMDINTFLDSAAALTPVFRRFFLLGEQLCETEADAAFARLRWPGMEAEDQMYRATGGVNTHKGAIFSLALLSAAWGRLWGRGWRSGQAAPIDAESVSAEAAALCASTLRGELAAASCEPSTAGQRQMAAGLGGGVRAEAASGYPTVRRFGLPVLTAALTAGLDRDRAGWQTLLSLMRHSEDSNLFARGGAEGRQQAASLLEALPDPPQTADIEALNERFCALNLSPGGSADLLALCFWFYYLTR